MNRVETSASLSFPRVRESRACGAAHRFWNPAFAGMTYLFLSALPLSAVAQEPAPGAQAPGLPPERTGKDRLELDATTITGSRELPKVMNILPWKRPPSAELRGQPDDSLLDEVLGPVNRVEFRRELRYEQGLPDAPR